MKKRYIVPLILIAGLIIYLIFTMIPAPTTTFGETINRDGIDEMRIKRHEDRNYTEIKEDALIDNIFNNVDSMTLTEKKAPHIENHKYIVTLYADNHEEEYIIYTGDDFIYRYGNTEGGYTIEGNNPLIENIDNADIEWEEI